MVMNKIVFWMSALAVLAACGKMAEPEILPEKEIVETTRTPLRLNLHISAGADTRAVKTDWENGDQILVFFPRSVKEDSKGKYLMLVYIQDPETGDLSWENNDYFNPDPVVAEDLPAAGKMTALFLPYGMGTLASWDAENGKYALSTTDYAYYMCAENADFTLEEGVLTGTLEMRVPEGFVQFFVPTTPADEDHPDAFSDEGTYYELRQDYIRPVGATGVAADGTVVTDQKNPGDALAGYDYGGGTQFSGIWINKDNPGDNPWWFSLSAPYETRNYALFRMGKNPTKNAVKLPAVGNWQEVGPDKWVLLGNGREVETVNEGASLPWDYGYYMRLLDGASMTENDILYLLGDSFDWTWMPVHGINGCVVSDKTNPGCFIFLPAAGGRPNVSTSIIDVGTVGKYVGKYVENDSHSFISPGGSYYFTFSENSRECSYAPETNVADYRMFSVRNMRSVKWSGTFTYDSFNEEVNW